MKYALLINQAPEVSASAKEPAAQAAGWAYGKALQEAGVFIGGAGLEGPQTATTVSVRDGQRRVQDGPYAETREFLAGIVFIEVPNLDAALEWAARHPAAASAAIEVRPVGGCHFVGEAKKAA